MKKIFFLSMLILSTITFLTNAQQNCDGTQDQWSNCNTNVSIHLNNSYSWSISRWDSYTSSGWYIRTNQITHPIVIYTTDVVQYTSSGDITNISWSVSNIFASWYQSIENATLSSTDGTKELSLAFIKEIEPYQSNILTIQLDTTAPSIATPVWPNAGILLTGNEIAFSRSDSIDTWIWLSHYVVTISLDPLFANPIQIVTTDSELILSGAMLPAGTLYRYVTSIDYLWNSSVSALQYFHYLEATKPKPTIWWLLNPALPDTSVPPSIDNTPDINLENITSNPILILSNKETLILDSTISLQEIWQISQDLIDQFHQSPSADRWNLPGLLPKTWVRATDIPHRCYYESCMQIDILKQLLYVLVFIMILLISIRLIKKNID